MVVPGRRQRRLPKRKTRQSDSREETELPGGGHQQALNQLLTTSDGATRERTVQTLQAKLGNDSVQRILTDAVAQREPGGGQPKTEPAKTWLRPLPTTAPKIDLSQFPTAFDKLGSQLAGHPYVNSLPVATAAEQATIEQANGYFESTPLQPWESAEDAGPEYQGERNKLTELFQNKAYQLALFTLTQSEQQASREWFRYSPDNGVDPVEVGQVKQAAAHLGEVQAALMELANVQNRMYEQGPLIGQPGGVDDYLDKTPFEAVPAANEPGGDNSFAQVSRDAMTRWPGLLAKYKSLRDTYGQRFPVLMTHGQDYAALAGADSAKISSTAAAESRAILNNIQQARAKLTPEKIWSLPIIIAQTKQLLGITEGTGANDAIQGKLDDIAWDGMLHKLAMAGMQLGLQIVAGMLTGGASLVVQGAAVAVGAAQVAEEYQEYQFGKATGARIAYDQGVKLAASEPGYGWLAFSIAGLVLDVGMAAMTFKQIVAPLKAANALADATQGVRALAAGEEAAAKAATTMADVEEIVRAQGRVLAQEGKLAEGMTEDIFVERVMSGLRRQVLSQGKVAEQQAGVVASVIGKTHPQYAQLAAGDREALTALLVQHGEWKSLVTALERGGQPEIAQHLLQLRGKVIEEIAAEVSSLSKAEVPASVTPMKGGSTELVSDVDLQIHGADAGQMMIEAEAYLARRFGDNWSTMFRLNFYTEGSRLTRYHEVLSSLKPAQRVAMTKRMTALTERYSFAKMLHHAGDDPARIGRVEAMAQRAGVELDGLRDLAKAGEGSRTAARNKLLQELDTLQSEYAAAKGERKIELAEQISAKQIEANFYTHEANIGPGSLGRSGSAGLELQETYQSALSQLEMIEHIIAEAGGDVARASREYELFKYVGRFAEAAEKAGKDSAKLKFLRNQAKAVSGGNRELMEETAHAYADAGKIRSGAPRQTDVPQHVGPSPAVTDEFLEANFRLFQEEAAETLARLNPSAARRSPVPTRAGRTTAPIRAVDEMEAAGAAGPRVVDHSDSTRYLVQDAANKRFSAEGHLENGGELSLTIRTDIDGARSAVLRGREQFDAIIAKFGGSIASIRGAWNYGTNLEKFNSLVRAGKTAEEAALATWTGQQAARVGFSKVTIRYLEGTAGNYSKVSVLFHR